MLVLDVLGTFNGGGGDAVCVCVCLSVLDTAPSKKLVSWLFSHWHVFLKMLVLTR